MFLLGKALGTHRFQRAVAARDRLIGISPPQTGGDALVPINSSFAETARWKRCVPRARFHSFRASQRHMKAPKKTSSKAAKRSGRGDPEFRDASCSSWMEGF